MVTAADFANLSLLDPYAPLQALLKTARVVTSDKPRALRSSNIIAEQPEIDSRRLHRTVGN